MIAEAREEAREEGAAETLSRQFERRLTRSLTAPERETLARRVHTLGAAEVSDVAPTSPPWRSRPGCATARCRGRPPRGPARRRGVRRAGARSTSGRWLQPLSGCAGGARRRGRRRVRLLLAAPGFFDALGFFDAFGRSSGRSGRARSAGSSGRARRPPECPPPGGGTTSPPRGSTPGRPRARGRRRCRNGWPPPAAP